MVVVVAACGTGPDGSSDRGGTDPSGGAGAGVQEHLSGAGPRAEGGEVSGSGGGTQGGQVTTNDGGTTASGGRSGSGGTTVSGGGADSEATAGAAGTTLGAGGSTGNCVGVSYSNIGTSCSEDGQICGDCSSVDPCNPCAKMVCIDGAWQLQEAFPPPSCGQAGSGGQDGGTGGSSGGTGGSAGSDACAAYHETASQPDPLTEACALLGQPCPADLSGYAASLSDEEASVLTLWDGCASTITIAGATTATGQSATFTFDRAGGGLVGVQFSDGDWWGPCDELRYDIGQEPCSEGLHCPLDPDDPSCLVTASDCKLGSLLPTGYAACLLDETAIITQTACTYVATITYSVGSEIQVSDEYQQCVDAQGECGHGDPTPQDPLVHEWCRLTYPEGACPTPASTSLCIVKGS